MMSICFALLLVKLVLCNANEHSLSIQDQAVGDSLHLRTLDSLSDSSYWLPSQNVGRRLLGRRNRGGRSGHKRQRKGRQDRGHHKRHHSKHSNKKKYGYKGDKHHGHKHSKTVKHHQKQSSHSSDRKQQKIQYSKDRRANTVKLGQRKDYDCDHFEHDGATFATLQALAAVFLRGMNMISSDDRRTRKDGLKLFEKQLYPYMLDSFEWENKDAGLVVASKRELKDHAEDLGESIPNSFGLESFPYFECSNHNDLKITMYFNAYERWDDTDGSPTASPSSEPTEQPSFEPSEFPTLDPTEVPTTDPTADRDNDMDDEDVVERWWNVEICFEWDEDQARFMMEKFLYDDPLSENE